MDTTEPRFAIGRRWADRQDAPRVVEIVYHFAHRRRMVQVRTVVAGASGSTGRTVDISLDTLRRRFDPIPPEDQE
jgi:hypothetical protein